MRYEKYMFFYIIEEWHRILPLYIPDKEFNFRKEKCIPKKEQYIQQQNVYNRNIRYLR